MKKTIIAAVVLLAVSTVSAADFGRNNKWQYGGAQGVTEMAGGNKQAMLLISCNPNDASVFISATLGDQTIENPIVTIDGKDVLNLNVIVADPLSPTNIRLLDRFLANMKKAKKITVPYNGKEYIIPTTGAAQVFGQAIGDRACKF